MEYVDSNSNGVPDVFEHRRPISDILNDDSVEYAAEPGVAIIAIENQKRTPQQGELFLNYEGEVEQASFSYSTYEAIIVKQILAGSIKRKDR